MHGSIAAIHKFVAELATSSQVDSVLFPPAIFLQEAAAAIAKVESTLMCGVQDIGVAQDGAHTGEIAAEMVRDLGGQWAIVGHSERRIGQTESDELVAQKAEAALRGALMPIVCVGETLKEREAGEEESVVARQLAAVFERILLDGFVEGGGAIAYEPVWAIGTGETASPEQAQQMHAFIRAQLATRHKESAQAIRVLYGGSVKPANAEELFAQTDIDGGLVGGAALDVAQFSAIIAAASKVG
jgi:triosephosphate isomerase